MDLNYEIVAENIRTELKKYIVDCGLKSLVIGISGGIDSVVCVALAKPVCDELKIPLIGRWIAIESNTPDEYVRAQAVGSTFCTNYKDIDMTTVYSLTKNMFEASEGVEDISVKRQNRNSWVKNVDKRNIRNGNIKARYRMMYLYNLAQLHGGMVLSTDNFTEYLLGFWTLHGDVGDYGMIQNLWKTEVYGLSKWIALNECDGTGTPCRNALLSCVDAIPTDGLGVSNSDLDQIEAESYDEVDIILTEYSVLVSAGLMDVAAKLENHPVIKRHINSEFKRKNPYNISREELIRGA